MISTPPPLLYHGGKHRLAPWIIGHFPPHRVYIEPFAGAMGVLLHKDAAETEIVNDLDGEVINFFMMLRSRGDELIRQIELTPYSRAEFNLAYEQTDDPLERARRLYVRSWMGYGVKLGRWRTGFKISAGGNSPNVIKRWTRVNHLWRVAERLRSTVIECEPAVSCIRRYDVPDALIYADPPYLSTTRSKWWKAGYNHDMTEDDHVELARVLHEARGMVILSGYPSDLYDCLYSDWRRVDTSTRNVASQVVTECLWLSPRVSEFLQVDMFSHQMEQA